MAPDPATILTTLRPLLSEEDRIDRRRARSRVRTEVHSGRFPSARTLPCDGCGRPARGYHHHNGYAPEHALDVTPLCATCHGQEHAMSRREPDPSIKALSIAWANTNAAILEHMDAKEAASRVPAPAVEAPHLQLLSLAEAASRLGVKETFVKQRIQRGELKAKHIGALVRINAADLEQYVSEQGDR